MQTRKISRRPTINLPKNIILTPTRMIHMPRRGFRRFLKHMKCLVMTQRDLSLMLSVPDHQVVVEVPEDRIHLEADLILEVREASARLEVARVV